MDSAGTLPYDLPFTLGHEVAGTVVAVGAGVSEEWLDEAVAVHGVWSCGECRRCRAGRENYCLRLTGPDRRRPRVRRWPGRVRARPVRALTW